VSAGPGQSIEKVSYNSLLTSYKEQTSSDRRFRSEGRGGIPGREWDGRRVVIATTVAHQHNLDRIL